jgi:hypothetical protein
MFQCACIYAVARPVRFARLRLRLSKKYLARAAERRAAEAVVR